MIVGMNPYFLFNGQGIEAVRFYEDVFGAEVKEFKTFADLPDSSEGDESLLLHANLKIADNDIMLSDADPDHPIEVGTHISVALVTNDQDETSDMFRKIRESEGEETMPLQETFFSPAYGKVKDKFGIEWQFMTMKE
ncbi:VOC family protein [Tenuibacillus multivorans]|uniref:PhnB protein n=1 Tax=Tenuibacillus multivorans TaxID=237069 RepID=A0A1H0AQ38_9BACI|nr:VOC family protein [Tenuibacillus multivorans]GEL77866.1 VOC family protein [Tenuibacillus multivorans]SDN35587.1 PhnB protein [Tenuibacillus multivorans]